MASRNTHVKLIRGAGTKQLVDTLYKIRNMKQRPLNYKANNDEGTVMVSPDYTMTKEVPAMVDSATKMQSVRVRWEPHTFAGLDGLITDWKKHLTMDGYNYPDGVAHDITNMRGGDLMEVLNLAIEYHKVLVTTTTYNVYEDKQVKVYRYNGDESPTVHPETKLPLYSNIRMGYMVGWKTTIVLNALEAKEIKNWLDNNKLVMDLLVSKASMAQSKLTYRRNLGQKKRLATEVKTATDLLASYLEKYDEQQAQYDEVVAWIASAPMECTEHAKEAILRRFFTRRPSQLLADYQSGVDRTAQAISHLNTQLEIYSGMGWGEEE